MSLGLLTYKTNVKDLGSKEMISRRQSQSLGGRAEPLVAATSEV